MIKKLARSIREYKRDCILTPVFVVVEVIMEVLIPFLMAKLIDEGISGGDMTVMRSTGTALIVCVLIGLLSGVLAGAFCATASAGFAKNLRQDLFDKIQTYSFANIDKFSTSSIVTRLTTDVTNVQNAFMMIIRIAVRAPFTLLFSLVAAFLVSAKLSLYYLVAIPILGVGLYLIVHFSHPCFERVFRIYDELNGDVQENLSGIRVVKSFVREDYEGKKFGKISEKIYKVFRKAESIVAWNMPLMQFAIYACMLLISWFGARMIVLSGATELTTGELSSMIAYAMSALNSLMMLSMVLVMINMARASSERIMELLDEEPTLKNPDAPVVTVKSGEVIFDHVGFSYQGDRTKECLHDISLCIPAGSTLGIIGSTGCGKSTLLNLIPRFYDVTSGKVTVDGIDVRDMPQETLHSLLGYVPQKGILFSGSIASNLKFGGEQITDADMKKAAAIAQAAEFIDAKPEGYDSPIAQGGSNVSGGQKQRLSIARAIAKHPKIYLFDDSFSALDYKTDVALRRALKAETGDATVIIVAQRISTVLHANQILVLEDGRIVGKGTHAQLMESCPAYQEIARSQLSNKELDLKGGEA